LLQEQFLSGWSQTMHMNSLAMTGDYRDFCFPATGRWSMALRSKLPRVRGAVERNQEDWPASLTLQNSDVNLEGSPCLPGGIYHL